MKIKKELSEDMEGDIGDSVSSGVVAYRSNGLLMAGVQLAVANAAARVGMEVAARPTTPATNPVQFHYQVKQEMHVAVEAAVNSVVANKPFLAGLLTSNVFQPATKGFTRNFELQKDGGGVKVKRKVVDGTRRLQRLPPPKPVSDTVRMVETVTIDGAGNDEEEDRTAGPCKPSPSPNEGGILGTAVEFAPGAAEAEAAARQPAEAPSAAGGSQGCPGGGGEQRHQPAPAGSPAGAAAPDTAAAHASSRPTAASTESGYGVDDAAVPPERPARKRRKSAEAGGWRSRYDKDEFESGEALLASSDGDGEEDWRREADDERAARSRVGGRPQPGGWSGGDAEDTEDADAESDELVDVGGEEDYDLDVDDGGGGGSGTRNGEAAVDAAKKQNPPNAWKRRCADGNCQLGASFGTPGKPAKYCSSHKDAGMVNVTHRRCEEPGCVHIGVGGFDVSFLGLRGMAALVNRVKSSGVGHVWLSAQIVLKNQPGLVQGGEGLQLCPDWGLFH